MKTKKSQAAVGMGDGDATGQTDGKVAMDGNGESTHDSLQLSVESSADEGDPNDRGMPGVSTRSQQQDMPEGSMEDGQRALAQAMPAGGMGGGDIGGGSIGGGGGGGGSGGDGRSADRPRRSPAEIIHHGGW